VKMMPKPSYQLSQQGIDYFFLIVKHVDRMSEGLKEGLEIGEINTGKLVGYYEQVIHYEGLLVPFLDKAFYHQKDSIVSELPGYSKTWSGKMEDQVSYFLAISKLFQLLMLQAYKKGVLKLKKLPESSWSDDLL